MFAGSSWIGPGHARHWHRFCFLLSKGDDCSGPSPKVLRPIVFGLLVVVAIYTYFRKGLGQTQGGADKGFPLWTS